MARTALTRSYASLNGYQVQALDDIFLSSRNFDTLNKKLAKAVLDASKTMDVCYCVDGAVCEDIACKLIMQKAKEVEVCEGISRSSKGASLAKLNSTHVLGISAYDLDNFKNTDAVVIYDIDSEVTAFAVKELLTEMYGEESPCTFIREDTPTKIAVYELDRQKKYDYSCMVAIEHADYLKRDRYDYADLARMMSMLRAPDGCPWDRSQTCESICNNIIEEAYELVDAIEQGDDDATKEETGDLLLQSAFVSQMKAEEYAFSPMDVTTDVVKKLIFRHSHIFGEDKVADAQSALGVWEKNKKVEKGQQTISDTLQAVPHSFPALVYAQKVGKRAGKAFDEISPISAGEKMDIALQQLVSALLADNKDEAKKQAGIMLMRATDVCRLAGLDAEESLRHATLRFVDTFIKAEQLVDQEGKKLSDLTQMDFEWYLKRAEENAD